MGTPSLITLHIADSHGAVLCMMFLLRIAYKTKAEALVRRHLNERDNCNRCLDGIDI